MGLIGITAFALILWITPYGSGVSPDSTVYIGAAKSLLSGKGFFVNGNPITHYPPLYSVFLAAANLLANNLVQAARFLNAILFGVNAGLVAWLVYLTRGRNFLAATCAAFFFLSSAPFLVLHSYAWSEPLFITFSLACIILLSMYVIRPTLSFLIASSLFFGCALLTRYIGMAFLPAALVIVFVGGGGQPIGQRFRNTLIWFMLACAPLGVWLIRNMTMAGLAMDRSFAFHPLSVSSYIKDFISTTFEFLAPISLPAGIRPAIFGLFAALLIALLAIMFKWHLRDINWRSMGIVMAVCCLLFSFSYLLFLYISISISDASTPVDTRLLSPILVILIVGGFSLIWAISQTLNQPIVWWCFLLLVALSISTKIPEAIQSATGIKQNGSGYTAAQWHRSETIAFIKSITSDVKIYSNGADVIGFLTEKQSLTLPYKTDPTTLKANSQYNEEMKGMCRDTSDNKALVVYFNLISWRWYFPNQTELESTCNLPILQRFADGTVYGEK